MIPYGRHEISQADIDAMACLAPGDVLWTESNTFVASANCGCYCGEVFEGC